MSKCDIVESGDVRVYEGSPSKSALIALCPCAPSLSLSLSLPLFAKLHPFPHISQHVVESGGGLGRVAAHSRSACREVDNAPYKYGLRLTRGCSRCDRNLPWCPSRRRFSEGKVPSQMFILFCSYSPPERAAE
jgi:hypothetical protein